MTLPEVEASVATMTSDQKLSWLCSRTFGISQDVSQLMLDVDYLKSNRHCPQHSLNTAILKRVQSNQRKVAVLAVAAILAMCGMGVIPPAVLAKILTIFGVV